MSSTTLAAPFPYFGGKRRAAPIIWQLLGDPSGYVEPFAGSAAVLLARPKWTTGRRVETINDADGWLVNVWRSIQLAPDDVARHAYGPVTEIDYHARLAWLQARRGPDLIAWLEGHPEHHDPKAAGWWLYVASSGIGNPWDEGPWVIHDSKLVDRRSLPHLGNAGKGVNRELPHLGDAGRGINRELPHLGNAGRGINRELPHLGDAGQDALRDYMRAIAARLQRVRITCGDWRRVTTPSVTKSGTGGGDGGRAVFLDPPYATSGHLYTETAWEGVAEQVRAWAASRDAAGLRIVLCGYDNEHDQLLNHGWNVTEGRSGGGAGYSSNSRNGRRERLWYNPACHQLGQGALFDTAGTL